MDETVIPGRSPAGGRPAERAPAPRAIGRVNWRGLWTLYLKEVRRFLKVFTQTVAAPVVTTLLFLAVFTLALGRRAEVAGVGFAEFLAPGLIMMAMAQNAFANTSSSIVVAKVQGNIVDLLMPPLSPGEITCGIVLGGLSRGLLVGLVVGLAMSVFVPIGLYDPRLILFHAVAAALMLSLLGTIGGIWADRFDHIAAVTNFVVTPLTFLSGTFYSIQRLPEAAQLIAHLNPFFYMIDGFRYGFIGHADAPVALGIAVMLAVDAALWALCHTMFARGYKLKP
jgi:ABC-2 type transport system permease protein